MRKTKLPWARILRKGLPIAAAVVLVAVLVLCAVLLFRTGRQLYAALFPQAETSQPELPKNLYGPEDFALEDGVMTCLSGDYKLGIDVNEWNGEIDWAAVKEAGVEFVFIRLGGRGWGEAGVLYDDAMAQSYYEGAKAQGLQVGAYFFSQAMSPEEAREEALYCLDLAKGWVLDLPLVYDWEYVSDTARTAGMTRRLLTDCTKTFCQTVEKAGYTPMIYANPAQTQNLLHLHEVLEYPFWLAMYDSPMDFPYPFHVWQYTGSGQISGISGPVDLNIMVPDQQTGLFLSSDLS